MNSDPQAPLTVHHEQPASAANGWMFLLAVVGLVAVAIGLLIAGVTHQSVLPVLGTIICVVCAVITTAGFFTLQPNESAVFTLFGAYRGTARLNGFLWANPFFRKQ